MQKSKSLQPGAAGSEFPKVLQNKRVCPGTTLHRDPASPCGLARLQRLGRMALAAAALTAATGAAEVRSAQLDPKAISIKLPEHIDWVANPSGSESAVLVGDPSKPGLYVVLNKWKAHHNSKPHSHPNDRFITVISGTWWVGTGTDYKPEEFKPVPAGSFVTHYGKEVHYDGARDGDVILQIVGIGPATATPAAAK